MARKIIKAFLFIFAAILVAGGIMTYLRSQKKINSPLQTQAPKAALPVPVKTSEIKDLTVNTQGSSAQVLIKGIFEHNYSVEHLATGDGFKITVPNTSVGQIQSMLDKPHPLIKKIEVRPSASNVGTAELVFHTEKDVNFLDTQKNDMLTIDFIKTESSGDEKATASAGTTGGKDAKNKTTASNATKSLSGGSQSSGLSKTSTKTSKLAAAKKKSSVASVSKKKKKGSTKLKPFVDSTDSTDFSDNSDLENSVGGLAPDEQGGSINDLKNNQVNNLSDFGSTGSAPATESFPQEEAPTIAANPAPKPSDADEGFMNLKDAVKEEPKGSANLLDAETQMSLTEKTGDTGQKMAALPNQKFDINQIQANLPALQNMTVARSGTATVVTFDREKAIAYKVFRMVNPSRIVVDFKDAKSKLKPEYPRFAGTKISRIETREYGSAEGMLVRVIMYVDGAPNFSSNKNGNQLVLEIQ